MKKIIYLTLATMFIASCSSNNTEEMTSEDLKSINADCDCGQIDYKRNAFGEPIKGSVLYDINSEKVFSGTCEEKWGDGSRKEIRQYSSGKLHGNIASWDESGNLRRHLIFSNGNQDGEQKVWDENKSLVSQVFFKNGLHDNKGYKYKDGFLDFVWFNFNGKTTKEITFYNPYSYSLVVQKDWTSDQDSPSYKIFINDELDDDIIIKHLKAIVADHFTSNSQTFTLNVDFVNGEKNQPDINIGYIEDKGWLTKEAQQKENEERNRIFKLVSENILEIKYSENVELSSNVQNSNSIEQDVSSSNETKNITYYKVSDPDGYSNLRDAPNGEILQKVYENELFEVIGDEEGYKKVKLSDGTVGYIHGSRVIKN